MSKALIPAFRVFQADSDWYASANLEEGAEQYRHQKCKGEVFQTIGFVPLENGELTYSADGKTMFRVKIETAELKASVVREVLDERIAEIEKAKDRKVVGKEKKELREQIEFELLPQAFRTSKVITGYFDDDDSASPPLLFIGTSSMSVVESVTGLLRKAFGGSLPITPIKTGSLVATLTEWVRDDSPMPFECVGTVALAGEGEERQKTAVFSKYDGLGADEIKAALEAGSRFKSGELRMMDESDEREVMKFKLAFDGAVSGITCGEVMMEAFEQDDPESALEAFESEFFIMTKTIYELVNQFFKHGVYQ